MKKILILLIAPILMATQCDEDNDPLVSTEYYIQNDSSIDLTFLTQDAVQIVIESNSSQFIAINTDLTSKIVPSESTAFDNVKLFKLGDNNMLVDAYEQNPINDTLWELNEINNLDFVYTLIITDELIE